MRWLKAVIGIVAVVALVALAVVLQFDNAEPVRLRFLDHQTPPVAVFWWLLAALVAGMLIGVALSAWGFVRGRVALRRVRRELGQSQLELRRIRAQTLHD